ncbi:hypothetical protein [Streptacidiphilus sp. PAMC 29251]
MGIKLMVEIMDHWQDAGLTAGERADLLVLAENAKDSTRETFGPVHEDYILKRVGKKAAAWRVAISALKAKGVLEYAIRDGREMSGQPGRHAVYRFPVLCPEAPHDGLRGQCTRSERVSRQLTHSEPGDDGMGYPSANALDGMGYPTATERVSPQLTPTPPISSSTTSSTPADPSASPTTGGGGGDQQQDEQRAEQFLQSLPSPWGVGRATARRQAPLLLEAIARQGWDLDADLAAHLTADRGPVKTYAGALAFRIDDLPKKPTARTRASPVLETCDRCRDQPRPGWVDYTDETTGRDKTTRCTHPADQAA